MKKYFALVLLSLFFQRLLLFSQPSFPGEGTEISPYQLWSKEHLTELCDSINNIGPPYYMSWTTDKYFRLMQDMDNVYQSIGWYAFSGYLRGNGKTINMAMPDSLMLSSIKHCYVPGLISLDNGSLLDSLTVTGYITYARTIFGVEVSSILDNCITNVDIVCYPCEYIISNIIYYWAVAGIAATNRGTISHCINNGNVTGVDFVAGIAAESFQGKIFNCINTGKITATGTEIKEWYDYTGVAGITIEAPKTDFSNCINLGDIEGHYYVGGIASKSFSALFSSWTIVKNCINAGNIKGKKYVGGIIGIDFDLQPADIYNCINTGIIEGEEDAGGIVGKE